MATNDKHQYVEYHQEDREYCRRSGPLNYKAIDIPPIHMRNGLGLVGAAATVLALVILLLPLAIVSTALHIGVYDATIRAEVKNRPKDTPILYILSPVDEPQHTVSWGYLESDRQELTFTELTADTDYAIDYYLEQEEGLQWAADFRFRTLPEPEETTVPTVPTEPPTPTEPTVAPPPETTLPTEPTAPTEPVTVPTEPPKQPDPPAPTKPAPEPTKPTQPPTKPTTPPTKPTEPTAPPTKPTDPPPTTVPTVPTEPSTPTTPPTEPTVPTEPVSEPVPQDANVTEAFAVFGDNDDMVGYRCTEVHTFTNVPEGDHTVRVIQSGSEVSSHTTRWNDGVLTVTFTGRAISPGSSATSKVELICEDGGRALSTQTVTTPKLTGLDMTVTAQEGGIVLYDMNGSLTQPSVGQVTLELVLSPDADGISGDSTVEMGRSYIYSNAASAFSQSDSLTIDRPGLELTAQAAAYLHWSLEREPMAQSMEVTKPYRIPDVSELLFQNIAYSTGPNYAYDVAAKFANLNGGTPVRAELYMEAYDWRWNEKYGENLIATVTDLTIDAQGALRVRYSLDQENGVPYEGTGHRWRIVLTWIDSSGTEQTSELQGSIEPPVGYFNNLSGTLWKENGVYVYDYVFYAFLGGNPFPGSVEFVTAASDRWDVGVDKVSVDGNLVKVTGRMTAETWSSPNIDTYWVWTEEQNGHRIYTGCESTFVTDATHVPLTAKPNADGTGFTDVSDRFVFHGAADYPSWGASLRVKVTLADGTVISLAPGETDATGQVAVNWDDDGSISVTVTQAAVRYGQTCTAELVADWLWGDSGDRAITTTSTNRCTRTYSEGG